jgi:hypothetical protein
MTDDGAMGTSRGVERYMDIYISGFDWTAYSEEVMPAFERWFLDGDERDIYRLFATTRCALEEQYLPVQMQHARTWVRAKAFVAKLPRGPHSRKEYAKLCSARAFTAFSDRFVQNYTPHLYQNSEAIRTIWGAIIEDHCLPWLYEDEEAATDQTVYALISDMNIDGDMAANANEEGQSMQQEVAALLKDVGLDDVADEMSAIDGIADIADPGVEEGLAANISPLTPRNANIATSTTTSHTVDPEELLKRDPYTDEEGEELELVKGIALGQQPNMLCLRGWLAGIDVRAMALFEYLACKRRRMPFGSDADAPYGTYCGYLMPEETRQLASALRGIKPCSQTLADADYKRFCEEQIALAATYEAAQLIDEVLPSHSREFLDAVRRAALQGLGLMCSMEA